MKKVDTRPSEGRLPRGQRIVDGWPILDLGYQPNIPLDKWRLEVKGLVENPVILTHDDILKLPQAEVMADWHCVTTWSMYDNLWQGVLLKDILELVKPKEEGKFLYFTSYDDYSTNVPLDVAMEDDSLLVYGRNGEKLSRANGGPYRTVVSQRYAWKSAKWIKSIEVLPKDKMGYWELRGYHNNADYRYNERYS